jgi:hypothetical protein
VKAHNSELYALRRVPEPREAKLQTASLSGI